MVADSFTIFKLEAHAGQLSEMCLFVGGKNNLIWSQGALQRCWLCMLQSSWLWAGTRQGCDESYP